MNSAQQITRTGDDDAQDTEDESAIEQYMSALLERAAAEPGALEPALEPELELALELTPPVAENLGGHQPCTTRKPPEDANDLERLRSVANANSRTAIATANSSRLRRLAGWRGPLATILHVVSLVLALAAYQGHTRQLPFAIAACVIASYCTVTLLVASRRVNVEETTIQAILSNQLRDHSDLEHPAQTESATTPN